MKDDVASIVERELGETPDRVERIEEGLLHESYEIRAGDAVYVLQFASDADDERRDSLRRGLGCYRLLKDSGIPVPRVVTEGVTESDGRRYGLVEKLPGETGETAVSPERCLDAGRYLARIHDARRFETAGWIRFEGREPTVEAFEEGGLREWLLRTVRERSRELQAGGMEEAGSAVERAFEHLNRGLPASVSPVLCHDDFTPDNALFRDEEVTGVLDFDRAYAGDAQRDLVKTANGFWMHDPTADWGVRARVYEGYREVADLDPSFERNEPGYRVETLAGTVAGMLAIGELSEYEREFYAGRILNAVDRMDGRGRSRGL